MKPSLHRDPVVLVNDVARMVRTFADARARDHGMTLAQWKLLVRLEQQPGMSQNELAALIEVEPITIGRLIDRLERRGMVKRCPDPSDRRIWRLHLTDAAEPMLKEITKDLQHQKATGAATEGTPDPSPFPKFFEQMNVSVFA